MTTQTDTIGGTSVNSGPGNSTLVGFVITPSKSGVLQSINVNVYTAAGNIRVGAYSGYAGGVFSGLISQSSSTAVSTTGMLYVPVSAAPVTKGVPIYLSIQRDNNSFSAYAVAAGTLYYASQAYGPFPDPTGSLSTVTYTFNMGITYTVTGPVPAPAPMLMPRLGSTSLNVNLASQFVNMIRGGLTGPHNHNKSQGGAIVTDMPVTITNPLQPAIVSRSQILNQNFNSDLWRGARYYVQTAQPNPRKVPLNRGDLWVNTSSGTGNYVLNLYDGSSWYPVVMGVMSNVNALYTSTSPAVVANTMTETSLVGLGVGSMVLPSDFLKPGTALRVEALMSWSQTAGFPKMTFNIKNGSNVLLTSGTLSLGAATTTGAIQLNALLACTSSGVTGGLVGQGDVTFYNSILGYSGSKYALGPISTVVDTTASQSLSLTLQWSAADPANSITCTSLVLTSSLS